MGKKLILVVDDEELVLSAIIETLKDKYQVVTANTGRDALDKIDANNPDLVIMDILMPEVDGFEAVKMLHEQRHPLKPPVIFLSAKTGQADIDHGLSLGGMDYITKPFSPSRLLTKIDEVFERIEIKKRLQQRSQR
jgi:DNA-binding response OmpR family regulator